jgi:cytidine deaminase
MIKSIKFADLSESDKSLIEAARDVSANAYAPYSGFAVGAAVRTKSGDIHTGANLENASYGLGMCAEVAAITQANSRDDYNIEAIAVIGHKFTTPRSLAQVVTPCGRCRQLIFEAGQIADVDVRILSCSGDLEHIIESNVSDFLPEAFGPKNLGLENTWPQMRAQLVHGVNELKSIAPIGTNKYSRVSRR